MVLFDNSFLTLVLHPSLKQPPEDPATGRVVENVPDRVDLLIETLEKDRETIIIPTPVLTEFLILIGEEDGSRLLTQIETDRNYQVESFDQRAAIELAIMSRSIRAKGGGRRGDQQGTYAKITFDRQIVAIAKVHNVTAIYSDDDGLGKFAEKNGLKVVRTWELPLPPEKHPLFRGTQLDESHMLEGVNVDEERKQAGNGAGETGTALARIPAVSRPSEAAGVSTEGGSGAREGEAGEE